MSINTKTFLARDNITTLYKTLISSNELGTILKEDKELLINQLIKIMRDKFKTLDISKITHKNINSVKIQFNKLCIKEGNSIIENLVNKYKKTDILHDRKYNRDFNTFKNPVNISNRPIPTNSSDISSATVFNQDNYNNNTSVNMNITGDNKSISDRLQAMEAARRANDPAPQVPQVPDFIKSVSVGKKNDFEQPANDTTAGSNYLQHMENDYGDFQPFGQTVNDFTNLEGMTFDNSKYDESISLTDRLAKLEQDRNSVQPLQSNNNIPPSNPPGNIPNRNPDYPPKNQPIKPPDNMPYREPNYDTNQQIKPPDNMPYRKSNYNPNNVTSNQSQIINHSPDSIQMSSNNKTQIDQLYNVIDNLKSEIDILKTQKYKENNDSHHNRTNIKNLQLDINKIDSDYKYQFNTVHNIIGIKLVSYSLPQPRYNILESKLNYVFNNGSTTVEKEIFIPLGYYNINNLLEILNNNEDIEFSLGYDQKIKINIKVNIPQSENTLVINKQFKLVINETSIKLGFTKNCDEFISQLLADKLLDLRLPTKIYMYILNLQNNYPFGILNFNGSSTCELTFNKPLSLNNLHILFLTESQEEYNFNELEYNLSFQINIFENCIPVNSTY